MSQLYTAVPLPAAAWVCASATACSGSDSAWAGASASSQDSGQPLPPDAIAALLAVDSLPLPEDLDCCLPAEQAAVGLHF